MVDALGEILASLLGGLVPDKIVTALLTFLMLLASIAFAILGGYVFHQLVTTSVKPVIGLLGLLLFALSAVSARLAWRGARSVTAKRDQDSERSR